MTTRQLTRLLGIYSLMVIGLAAGVVWGLPLVAQHAAPFQEVTSECLVCGRMRTVVKSWLQAPTESFSDGEDFQWMQPKIDPRHDHWWISCSTHARPDWFAHSHIGCGGGIGGVSLLHQLAIARGEDVASPYTQKYQQLLADRNLKAIREFVHHDVQEALTHPPLETSP